MDVDDAYTKVVGEFGRYQLQLFIIINIFSIVIPALNLLPVFVAAKPEDLKVNPRAGNDSTILIEWNLLDKEWISNSIQSLFYAGFLVGVIAFGQMSDRFGRRRVFIAGSYFIVPLSIATAISPNWKIFAACRFLTGLFAGGFTLVQYVYLQEMFGQSWWALTGTIINSYFSFGIAYLVFFAYFVPNWRHLIFILNVLLIIPLIYIWYIPESPRWLYAKGRLSEAEQVLVKMAKRNGVRDPIISLVRKPVEEKTNANLIDLIRNSITRKRIFIMGYIWFVNSFVYYALTLAAGDIGSNLYISELLSGLIELPPQIWCVYLLNRRWCGRNRILSSALLISGVSCLILMAFKHTEKTWSKMIFGLVGKMMISSSFNTLYVYSPELFPTSVRNVALGSASMCARVGGILSSFAPSMISSNAAASYAAFGAFGVTAGFLTMLLPETLGRKPPDSFEDLNIQVKTAAEPVTTLSNVLNVHRGRNRQEQEANPLLNEIEEDEHVF